MSTFFPSGAAHLNADTLLKYDVRTGRFSHQRFTDASVRLTSGSNLRRLGSRSFTASVSRSLFLFSLSCSAVKWRAMKAESYELPRAVSDRKRHVGLHDV